MLTRLLTVVRRALTPDPGLHEFPNDYTRIYIRVASRRTLNVFVNE